MKRVFISFATQISAQKPLSDEWMTDPFPLSGAHIRSLDPLWKEFIPLVHARRMGRLLKRALVTSRVALAGAGLERTDAIITGSGLGCMENTERFLGAICRNGEDMLSPTDFMQSTHNTISSMIAIQTGNHGYNSTYSHGVISFESALLDAFIQLRTGKIASALVGSHDETTEESFTILTKAGYFGRNPRYPATETSVAMVLRAVSAEDVCRDSGEAAAAGRSSGRGNCEPDRNCGKAIPAALCELSGMEMIYRPGHREIEGKIKAMGVEKVFTEEDYKPVFGENFSVSALGVYAAAKLIAEGKYSDVAVLNRGLCGRDCAIVHLKAVCGD